MKLDLFTNRDAALAVIVLLLGFYLCVCTTALMNSRAKERSQKLIISNQLTKSELARSYRHDAAYFRDLADRLQVFPHEPSVIQKCYETAIEKGPADYRNFLSYARYLTYQNCCQDQERHLISEAAKRARNDAQVHLEAGQLLVQNKQNEAALSYFNRAGELGARFTEDVYFDLQRKGLTVEAMNQITKPRVDSLLSFVGFLSKLSKNGHGETNLLHRAYRELSAMQLKPDQRLTLAKLAYRAGDGDVALREAEFASRQPESRLSALKLLSEIYDKREDWIRYQQVMKTMENDYHDSGLKNKACQVAMKSLKTSNRLELRNELTDLLAKYPECSEAFYKLSQLSSPSLVEARKYAQQAVAMDPEEFRYSDHLAAIDIEMRKYDEAEQIYNHFLNSDSYSSKAYIGLAKCKETRGERSAAIELLKNAINKSDNTLTLWKELGRLYSANRAYSQAADAYLQYAQLSSHKAEGFILAADAFKNGGFRDHAREQYLAALKVDGTNQRAIAALKSMDSSEENR